MEYDNTGFMDEVYDRLERLNLTSEQKRVLTDEAYVGSVSFDEVNEYLLTKSEQELIEWANGILSDEDFTQLTSSGSLG